ncbi:MAG: NADH:ubiquinone reductase (Na(+)-transporting) subunit D [Bacteroidota bacterium]
MAETTTQAPLDAPVKKKEPTFAFGKKERALIYDPLLDNNPITIQVLGICSALAVTAQVVPSLVMSVAVVFVCAFANLFTSLLRNAIPKQIRLIAQLVIIATLVTVVELVLRAASYPVYRSLSVYIGLIITNCIVMGRLEAFAMAQKPWKSFLDGVGNGLGYGLILVAVAVVREFMSNGTLFTGSSVALNIIGAGEEFLINTTAESGIGTWFSWYQNNGLMALSVSSMFVIAVFIWIQRAKSPKLVDIS